MIFLYVDESGDAGKYVEGISHNSPHFVLSGLLISETDWIQGLDNLKTFRQYTKKEYGLLLREEIHSSELIRISKTESYRKIRKSQRIAILRDFSQQIPLMFPNSKLINICLKKQDFPEETNFMELGWKRLIQRYDTFLKRNNNQKGIIITDDTDSDLLRNLVRKMRVYNPIPSNFGGSYQAPTNNILEDPFARNSQHSYFIQVADCVAHTLYRKEFPKGSLKKFGVDKFFDNLEPILLKQASRNDPSGVVRR